MVSSKGKDKSKKKKIISNSYEANTTIRVDRNKQCFNPNTKTNIKKVNVATIESITPLGLLRLLQQPGMDGVMNDTIAKHIVTALKKASTKNPTNMQAVLMRDFPNTRRRAITRLQRNAKGDVEDKAEVRRHCALLSELNITLALRKYLRYDWVTRNNIYTNIALVRLMGVQANGKVIAKCVSSEDQTQLSEEMEGMVMDDIRLSINIDKAKKSRMYIPSLSSKVTTWRSYGSRTENKVLVLGIHTIPRFALDGRLSKALGPLAITGVEATIMQYLYNQTM